MKSIQEQLLLHEGFRPHAYLDTRGYWTVGIGYNLSARGTGFLRRVLCRPFPVDVTAVTLTRDEALTALAVDLANIEAVVRRRWPFYDHLDAVRRKVVLDMVYNMGHGAESFRHTIAAIERQDWEAAADGILAAKWAHQVDDGPGGRFGRADRLSVMLRTGQDYVA